MQVFRFTYSLKTRDNFARIAVMIISELQKAMKMLSRFYLCVIFVPLSAYTGLFLQMNLHIQKKAVSLRRKINPLAPNNNIVKRIKS